jgi:indolepyruvate ferredoxin oxidoreductase beta subunit
MSPSLVPIRISLHAIGGQGGGVLSDWIVAVARHCGWLAQATSVPGVAQRTGATVYYIELFPRPETTGREPVFALMPTAGEVDLVVAAELMEAGRAINRGLVTSDRTTLVTSTNRIYSIGEKSQMGDGRFQEAPVLAAAKSSARRLIAADMEAAAERTGSMISAPLFGAVAGCGLLPFARSDYETVIRAAGVAATTNLAGFAAGFAAAQDAPAALLGREPVATSFLIDVQKLVEEGARRLTDYQDRKYADLYRERLSRVTPHERADALLSRELARYLALWMSYEDTVRVADLKTRAARFRRVQGEVDAKAGQLVNIVEYLHPRLEEICDVLPAALGKWVMRSPRLHKWLAPLFARGRHISTSKLSGFLLLYGLAGLRRWRRGSFRYARENAKIESWLDRVAESAAQDYELAVEIVRCQRLIKGYGDTYERGWRNFSTLMAQLGQIDAPTLSRYRLAALADDEGRALNAILQLPTPASLPQTQTFDPRSAVPSRGS